MKLLDDVKVLNNNYEKQGIRAGMVGTIIDADIRWGSFYVNFQDQRVFDKDFMSDEENIFKLGNDISLWIKIEDLEVFAKSSVDDKTIYENLPEGHKDYWCKVEEGFILNLKGARKNKIPYDYNS